METGSVVHDGVGITLVGYPAAPYPSLGSGQAIRSTCMIRLGLDLPVEIEDENTPSKNLVRQISPVANL